MPVDKSWLRCTLGPATTAKERNSGRGHHRAAVSPDMQTRPLSAGTRRFGAHKVCFHRGWGAVGLLARTRDTGNTKSVPTAPTVISPFQHWQRLSPRPRRSPQAIGASGKLDDNLARPPSASQDRQQVQARAARVTSGSSPCRGPVAGSPASGSSSWCRPLRSRPSSRTRAPPVRCARPPPSGASRSPDAGTCWGRGC